MNDDGVRGSRVMELPIRFEKIGPSDYFVFYKTKKWQVYKTALNWWYIYEWLDDDYAAYVAMGKTRNRLVKEYVK